MPEDREVLREVWDGRIATCFSLFQDDLYTMAVPDPCFLMLPRLSYLPLVTEKVKKHFHKFVHPDRQDSEMWFDFDGVPVKWHLPIGLLFDQCSLGTAECASLPWKITVHFGNFPADEILKLDSKESIESHFMSSIKEADQIKHSGRVISSMQKKDHVQLWQGLQNDKFEQFWAINRKLMEVTGDSEGFKNVPVRMYKADKPLAQKLIKSFYPVSMDVDDIQESNQVKRAATLFDMLKELAPDRDPKGRVLLHGIEPELDTPLQWLSEHMSYPDNFLHICID